MFDCLFGELMEGKNTAEQQRLFWRCTVHVDIVETALLKKTGLDHIGGEEDETLLVGQGIRSDKPHDVRQPPLFFQNLHGL